MNRNVLGVMFLLGSFTVPAAFAGCDQVDLTLGLHMTSTSNYSCDGNSQAFIYCAMNNGSPANVFLEIYHDVHSEFGQVTYTHESTIGDYFYTDLTFQAPTRQCFVAEAHGYIADVEEPALVWFDETRGSGFECCVTPNF